MGCSDIYCALCGCPIINPIELIKRKYYKKNEVNWLTDCYTLMSNNTLYKKAIVDDCNQYFDEYLTSITTRYSLMCDLSPAEIEIIKEVKVPNIQTDSFFNKFDKMAQKEKEKAFTLVQKKFNWIQDDRYL